MAQAVQEFGEIERKYEMPDRVGFPPLAGLPGVASAGEPEEETLEAVYFDTADLDLARAGVTLRRRAGGADEGWHLKLPVGPDERRELRAPLRRPGSGADEVPGELAQLVTVHTRGGELSPVAHVRTTRTRRLLRDEAGEVLAEVVDDRVSGQTVGDRTTVSSWREVEVELSGGGRKLFGAVEKRLASAGARPARNTAKLERVLEDRWPADPGERWRRPRPKSRAGEVVMAYVAEQVATIKAYDPRVRRDEPDSVHKMRVATRRLRSALQAYGRLIDRDATRGLSGELKWLATVLGAERDTEVMADRLAGMVAATDDDLVLGPVAARVTDTFAGRRARTHADVLETLDGARYLALLDALDALVDHPPLTRRARRRARAALPREVARTHRRVARRAATAAARSGPARDVALHETRKAAKRARYAAEAATPVYGKQARRYAKGMKKVQELLGEHQDGVTLRQVLRQLGAQAHLAGENGFTFGLLHEREGVAGERSAGRFPKAWQRAGRPRRRRWQRT
ncbi:MAG: CHAD domain-containing protein [Mycobacteriales bacterium]